jgi:CNT family concentrative nucleoside transporter
MPHLTGFLGVGVLILLALAMSWNRRAVPWRLVVVGVLMQVVIAALILRVPGTIWVFQQAAWLVDRLIAQSDAGIAFLFGPNLSNPSGPWGFVFAFRVLPIIIFFASLMSVLYHVGVMQRLVAGLAWLMRRTMGVTGAEALCMAAGIFLGQTESPLTVKPLLAGMTRAQLMTVMLGGFANIAGSVLGAFVSMLGGDDPAQRVLFATHLMASSVMSAPAAFVIARIILPETETPPAEDASTLLQGAPTEEQPTNLFDAAAIGATDGLKLAANVAGMLVAFVSLLAVLNALLGGVGGWFGAPALSIQQLLGWVLAPLAWTMGIPWNESAIVGGLIGEKLVLTEFVAYTHLGQIMHPAPLPGGEVPAAVLSPRSAQIAAYALCGFSNFASIAIQIGGLSVMAPTRRKDFSRLALRAMLGGALATQMTACVASLFI